MQAKRYFARWVYNWSGILLLGCQTQSKSGFFIFKFLFFKLLFSVSGKVLPVTPLLSGVFVHGVFCAYFVKFEGAGVMRRFPWCTQENI